MKTLTAIFFSLFAAQGFSQTDNNGNPVFNSVSTSEDSVKDFKFISNYYTLKNNIEHKGSSVYISNTPTLDETLKAAVYLPSDFFILTKKQGIVNMIMLVNQPSRKFIVGNPATGKKLESACSLVGDITENRAAELIRENYDPKAKIKDGKLYFNGKELSIIPSQEIKKKVLELIEEQKLNSGDGATIKILSKEELKKIVVAESKEGGKLDFFTEIKGREMEGIEIKPRVISTRIGIALYKWGRANFELGVNTVEDALEFWSELKGRQPNQRESAYIKLGFNKELEK